MRGAKFILPYETGSAEKLRARDQLGVTNKQGGGKYEIRSKHDGAEKLLLLLVVAAAVGVVHFKQMRRWRSGPLSCDQPHRSKHHRRSNKHRTKETTHRVVSPSGW